jgi:hypothetical protein
MKAAIILGWLVLLGSCVSQKDFNDLNARHQKLNKKNREMTRKMDSLQIQVNHYEDMFVTYQYRIDSLQRVIAAIQSAKPVAQNKNNKNQPTVQIKPESSLIKPASSPVAKADFSEWKVSTYAIADVASGLSYLNEEEKEFFRLWNLFRMNPQLFLKTYLKDIYETPVDQRTRYEQSLVEDIMKAPPKSIVRPDRKLFESAKCHAYQSGIKGYVGHSRKAYEQACPTVYAAECCSYGNLNALGHLENLLVDEGVPSLGHREALMGDYLYAGISFQPHKGYTENVVIDMSYRKIAE